MSEQHCPACGPNFIGRCVHRPAPGNAEQKHSPLPWRQEGYKVLSRPGEARSVAHCSLPANAALIVERVNGWDEMVKERDDLKTALHTEQDAHASLHDLYENVEAERDELRACIECLLLMLPSCNFNDRTHVADGCYLCKARALLARKVKP